MQQLLRKPSRILPYSFIDEWWEEGGGCDGGRDGFINSSSVQK